MLWLTSAPSVDRAQARPVGSRGSQGLLRQRKGDADVGKAFIVGTGEARVNRVRVG